MKFLSALAFALFAFMPHFAALDCLAAPPWQAHGPLRASPDGHRLVHADGTPFIWLGDTTWAIHQNISREEVAKYLDDVVAKRFTIIQLMSVNMWALKDGKNYYGQPPYLDGKPWKLNPPYWEHVAWVIDQAAKRGLYVLLVYGTPGRTDNHGPYCRTPEEAYRYGNALGRFLGRRPNLIWSSGIDVCPDDRRRVAPMGMAGWHAMAEGVTDGVYGVDKFDGQADWSATLMTYHPSGANTSSKWFHDAPWLDFNGAQLGLRAGLTLKLRTDFNRRPPKPVVNIEPWYENCPWKKPAVGDWEMRCQAYQSLFAGAWGFTYGNYYIYQFDSPGEPGGFQWRKHINDPGRLQMRYVRRLMELPGFARRVPAPELVVEPKGQPQRITDHISACAADDGSAIFVFSPQGRPFTLNLGSLRDQAAVARWYNPRTGRFMAAQRIQNGRSRRFVPPGERGRGNDWLLVVQSAG